jgi:hypothetical protein
MSDGLLLVIFLCALFFGGWQIANIMRKKKSKEK